MSSITLAGRAALLALCSVAGCGERTHTFTTSNGRSARLELEFNAMDSDDDRRVTVAEWQAKRRDSAAFSAVDQNGDGVLTSAEFLASAGVQPGAASAGAASPMAEDPGAPDMPETEEPPRRRVAGADDEEAPPGSAGRRRVGSPTVEGPAVPGAPVKRPPPRPVVPPR
jgi:hypothetical protein